MLIVQNRKIRKERGDRKAKAKARRKIMRAARWVLLALIVGLLGIFIYNNVDYFVVMVGKFGGKEKVAGRNDPYRGGDRRVRTSAADIDAVDTGPSARTPERKRRNIDDILGEPLFSTDDTPFLTHMSAVLQVMDTAQAPVRVVQVAGESGAALMIGDDEDDGYDEDGGGNGVGGSDNNEVGRIGGDEGKNDKVVAVVDSEAVAVTAGAVAGVGIGADLTGADIRTGVDISTNIGTDINTNVSTNVGADINTDNSANIGTDISTNINTNTKNIADTGVDVSTDVNTNVNTNISTNISTDINTDTNANSSAGTFAITGTFVLPDIACRLADRDDLRIRMSVELVYGSAALRDEVSLKRGALAAVAGSVVRKYEYGDVTMPALRRDLLDSFNRVLAGGALRGVNIQNFTVEQVAFNSR